LRAKELNRLVFDHAEVDKLAEGLANFANERAAGHGDDDVVGQTPAELLGDLVAYGLRALCIVGTEVDVDETPAILVGDESAKTVDVIVVAVDADEARAVDEGVEDLGGLEIGGHQNAGLNAEAGGLRGDGVRKIASGGAADGSESKLARVGQRNRDDTVLEAEGWEADGVVLDVEVGGADALAEVGGADERGKAYGKVGLEAFGDGQETGVAPDAGRTGGDGLTGKLAAGRIKIVHNFEGCDAVWAGRERLVAVAFATFVALELIRGTGIVHLAVDLSPSRRGSMAATGLCWGAANG